VTRRHIPEQQSHLLSFRRENIAELGTACVPHKSASLATLGTFFVDESFMVYVTVITVVLHRCTIGEAASRTDSCMRAVRVHISMSVNGYIRTYVRTYMHSMYIQHTYIHTHIHAYLQTLHTYVRTYVRT